MCFEFEHGLAYISILSYVKFPTHSGFHDLFLNSKLHDKHTLTYTEINNI